MEKATRLAASGDATAVCKMNGWTDGLAADGSTNIAAVARDGHHPHSQRRRRRRRASRNQVSATLAQDSMGRTRHAALRRLKAVCRWWKTIAGLANPS